MDGVEEFYVKLFQRKRSALDALRNGDALVAAVSSPAASAAAAHAPPRPRRYHGGARFSRRHAAETAQCRI